MYSERFLIINLLRIDGFDNVNRIIKIILNAFKWKEKHL